MKQMTERTPVVTAFLYSGEKIALIKRSERVGTYRGAWAAFSGYVEHLPLNQAWLELEEEAGVSRKQARLAGIGIPLPVDDVQAGHRCLIFPFIFELADGIEIKTDWEASEWDWFRHQQVHGLNAVPRLADALHRVWPPFGDREFWDGLGDIATNTDAGATELARRGLAVLGGFVQANYDILDRPGLLRAVRALAACRPTMGVFPDLAARLLLAMEREGGQFDFDALVTEILGVVTDATVLSVRAAVQGLEGKRRLFTLSHSEVVRDIIMAWQHEDSLVVVAESQPRREGLDLAEFLSNEDVKVRVIPDAEIELAVRNVDAVLVGCDAITDTDHLVNKVGTRRAVLAANEAGVPTSAVTQTFKIEPPGWPVFLEMQSPADLGWTSDVTQAGAPVFDLTPLDAFTAVYTEEGPLTSERLREIRAELGSVELIPGA